MVASIGIILLLAFVVLILSNPITTLILVIFILIFSSSFIKDVFGNKTYISFAIILLFLNWIYFLITYFIETVVFSVFCILIIMFKLLHVRKKRILTLYKDVERFLRKVENSFPKKHWEIKEKHIDKFYKAVEEFNKGKIEEAKKLAKEALEIFNSKYGKESKKMKIREEEINTKIEKITSDIENGVYLTNQNWEIFKNFISNTNKSLDIMTNVISAKTSLSLLSLLKNRKVKIRILTRRILKVDFNKLMELKNNSKFDLEIYRCSRLHAKIFIRDGKKAMIGSPNFTYTSIGEEEKEGYVEGYYTTEDKKIIKSAKSFFNSIWSEKDITVRSDKFLTSKRGGIPKKIIEIIKSEKEELSIVMNSSLIQLNMIDDIIEEFNKNLRLRIITNWPSETNSETKETLYHLRGYSNLKSKDFELVPKKQTIHAKIYIFKSKKLAFISSMNLHRNSWLTSFEAGVIIDDKKEIEDLSSYINSLETIEAEDIGTNENIGLTLEDSVEADRQAASLIQTKKIPFPLEGERWINVFTKATRVKIKRFKRILKRLSKESKERTKSEEIPWMKPSISTGLEAQQVTCKICRQRPAVNVFGGICDHCREERHIKDESFTV